jgi:hypothetical protein
MSDKGDACDDLAELFAEKPDTPANSEVTSSEGTSDAHPNRGRHLGHERAAGVAHASFEMARGLFAHVMDMLA